MQTLEAQTSVLSVVPAFDERVGRDLLAQASGWLFDPSTQGKDRNDDDPIRALRVAGLIREWSGVMRIAEPIRQDFRTRLAKEEPEQFRATAEQFAAHARNGFQDALDSAIGTGAAKVSVAVLEVLASPGDREPADRLIDLLQSPTSLRRRVDTSAAARQLSLFDISHPGRDRLRQFLLGLDAWRNGDRPSASTLFQNVSSRPVGDRVDAIANHLLGVYNSASGDFPKALDYLETSVRLLRQQDDQRGLAQALTTYGRTIRLVALTVPDGAEVSAQSDSQMSGSVLALSEAVRIGRRLGDSALESVPTLEIARVQQAESDLESAVETTLRVVALPGIGDQMLLESNLLLGSLYRDLGRLDEAGHALSAAMTIARGLTVSDLTLARALNVQASAERRGGQTVEAVDHARESVQIGRDLNSRRHLSHALHTLGAALVDLGTPASTAEAKALLQESRSLVMALGDLDGQNKVERTLARLEQTSRKK